MGASVGPKAPRQERIAGVRLATGEELYFQDCALVDAAVNNNEITSAGSDGCMGLTPLTWALTHYPNKVSTLLDAGANPNTVIIGGITPLHLALSKGKYRSAVQLLESGADPAAVTDAGVTSLHALYQGCSSCETNEKGGTIGSPSRKRMASQIITAVGRSSLNSKDNFGSTPLHYAASSSDASEKISELVQFGADPKIRDRDGAPIWFYAQLAGNSAASERLRILAGDPVGALDDLGRSKEEWTGAARRKMDEIRPQMEPEAIKASMELPALPLDDDSCEFWLGLACAVVGGLLCTALCGGLAGPFAFLCGALCAIGAFLGCWAAIEILCQDE